MLDWLKKFEETSLGMLFSDQMLSPSEVVRISHDACATKQFRTTKETDAISSKVETHGPACSTTH